MLTHIRTPRTAVVPPINTARRQSRSRPPPPTPWTPQRQVRPKEAASILRSAGGRIGVRTAVYCGLLWGTTSLYGNLLHHGADAGVVAASSVAASFLGLVTMMFGWPILLPAAGKCTAAAAATAAMPPPPPPRRSARVCHTCRVGPFRPDARTSAE